MGTDVQVSQEADNAPQVDLPVPVRNMARHIMRVAHNSKGEPLIEFRIYITREDGRAFWHLRGPDGQTFRLGVVE